LGVGGRGDGGAAGGEQHLQTGPRRPGLRGGQAHPGQSVACSAFGVDHIGLRPGPPRRTHRAVELDDQLTSLAEVSGQTGAVAAGAFHRPAAQPAVLLGQREQLRVPVGVGGDGGGGYDRAGVDRDHAAVWVSAWVSTPMTSSTSSASMDMRSPCSGWTCCRSGPVRRSAGL